ncbi:MAG: glycosyl hydrolase, partial [Lutimonas sp.]
ATMGRSFWIYDDLGLLRQWDPKSNDAKLFTPEPAILANWYGGMNSNSATGTSDFTGVNPATGMVIYYNLSEVKKDEELTLEIRDAKGELVNRYTSKKDSTYVKYEGGPSKKPVLNANKGMNRFVWNMRHDMLLGAPKVYIEGSFRGHKAIPGTYSLKLSYGDAQMETSAEIKNNPLYEISQEEFLAYDEFMSQGEKTYNEMTQMTNQLYEIQQKLTQVVGQLNASEQAQLKSEAQELLKELKAFDAAMVQRLSKAYDDVENFENGFTAHYITTINQTDSSIPKVTNGARNRMKELNTTWEGHKKTGSTLLNTKVPAMNKKLFDSGFGALFATK